MFIILHPFQKDEQRFFINEYYNGKYCKVNTTYNNNTHSFPTSRGFSSYNFIILRESWLFDLEKGNTIAGVRKRKTATDKLTVREKTKRALMNQMGNDMILADPYHVQVICRCC